MIVLNSPPEFPAGEFVEPGDYDEATRESLIQQLEMLPQTAADAVQGLSDEQLDTPYRNWTIRQIIHHLADSHINCYVRFKWSLTEDTPVIKSYDETRWSEVVDAKASPVESSLTILSGIHSRWCQLLRRMSDDDYSKGFVHPELQCTVSLKEALPSYVWHGRHHLAQVEWVKANCL